LQGSFFISIVTLHFVQGYSRLILSGLISLVPNDK